MKPEPSAAIPKGIATGYKVMVTKMHIDLISVIFSRIPTCLN